MQKDMKEHLINRFRDSYSDVKHKVHHKNGTITIDFIQADNNKIFLLDDKFSIDKLNHLYLKNPHSAFLLNDNIYGLIEEKHSEYYPYRNLEKKYYDSSKQKFITSNITNYFARLQENHHGHDKPQSIITFYDPEDGRLYNAVLEKIFLDSAINSDEIRLYNTTKEKLKHMYAGKLIDLNGKLKVDKGFLSLH